MTDKEIKDFNEANKAEHSVKNHWAYKYLEPAGFKPLNDDQVGFVRRYKFQDDKGRVINTVTGSSCDYWELESGWDEVCATDEYKKLVINYRRFDLWSGLRDFMKLLKNLEG